MAAENKAELQLYVDTQLEEINPFKIKSTELLVEAKSVEIKDAKSVREATALRKRITGHKTAVTEARKDITRQFDDVKDQFMKLEKASIKDADEAQQLIQKKLLEYEEAEEKKRLKEEKRIDSINANFETAEVVDLTDEDAVEEELRRIDAFYDELPKKDAANADVKLAYANTKQKLLEIIDDLMLGVGDVEAEAATASADVEDAELELKLKSKAAKSAPKLGIKKVTKFEVVTPGMVPVNFNGVVLCIPDEKAIRKFIKDNPGVDIPGVKIWQEKAF